MTISIIIIFVYLFKCTFINKIYHITLYIMTEQILLIKLKLKNIKLYIYISYKLCSNNFNLVNSYILNS